MPTRLTTGAKASTSVRSASSSAAARSRRRVIPKAQIVACLQLQLGELLEQLHFLRVELGKPASIICTPSASSASTTRTFSPTESDIPSTPHAVAQGRVVELHLFHLLPFESEDRGEATRACLRGMQPRQPLGGCGNSPD